MVESARSSPDAWSARQLQRHVSQQAGGHVQDDSAQRERSPLKLAGRGQLAEYTLDDLQAHLGHDDHVQLPEVVPDPGPRHPVTGVDERRRRHKEAPPARAVREGDCHFHGTLVGRGEVVVDGVAREHSGGPVTKLVAG